VSQSELPNDKDERNRVIEELSNKAEDELNDLTSEFFTYPDDLTELLYDYVCANPISFGKVP
jgi:Domain of unknown function (DUF4375)